MNEKFLLKILGDMRKVLGIEVEYGQNCLLMRQQKNLQYIMEEFMVDELVTRVPSTPLSSDKANMLVKHTEPQQADVHLPLSRPLTKRVPTPDTLQCATSTAERKCLLEKLFSVTSTGLTTPQIC
jgi:hypothetical protein